MSKQILTKYGIIEGVDCGTYTVFKGIPYAKQPVGDLRWRAPQEPEPWEGVYHADRFGKMCYQDLPSDDIPITGRYLKEFYSNPDFLPEMGEDCLNLNIWVPNNTVQHNALQNNTVQNDTAQNDAVPVAFWIHGGGFGGGYNSELEFDGQRYCEKGVILVTVNYRLGAFGFLAHPWLTAESAERTSGNYGILDQIQALKWVYENIHALGGDPDKITVFGQSAGSMSTQVLVSTSLTEHMISKAILQSGLSCADHILLTPTLKEAEENGITFAEFANVNSVDKLRAMTAEEIMTAKRKFDQKMWQTGQGISMVPNADGYLLKESVKDVWLHGNMKKIPYMLGTVTDDLGATPEEIRTKTYGILMEECKRWAKKCSSDCQMPSYLYYFCHELPGDDWGAFHSAELWYMFGTLDRCWRSMTETDYALSDKMVTYWTNFIKAGEPALAGTEPWEPYTEQNEFIKVLG